jgi:hypothetical protein
MTVRQLRRGRDLFAVAFHLLDLGHRRRQFPAAKILSDARR